MNNIIDELKSLIVNPKKGTTGYTCLKNSERVTAHKLNVLINKPTNELSNSKAAIIGAILGATFGVGFFAIEIITILLRLL